MNRKSRIVTAMAMVAASAAHADMARLNQGINPDIAKASNQVSFGFGELRQDYREFNDGLVPTLPPILDYETGSINSYRVAYTAMLHRAYVQTGVSYSHGDTDYIGYLVSPGPVYTPFNTTTTNTMVDILVRAGYTFPAGSMAAIVPYVELGDHSWWRAVGRSTPYYSGSEVYYHLSIGLGVKALVAPVERLVLEVGAGYGTNFLSTMTTQGYDYTLGDRAYLSGYTSVDYRFVGNWHLKASADFRKWEYGQSDVVGGFLEPHSLTRQVQYLVSVGYNF